MSQSHGGATGEERSGHRDSMKRRMQDRCNETFWVLPVKDSLQTATPLHERHRESDVGALSGPRLGKRRESGRVRGPLESRTERVGVEGLGARPPSERTARGAPHARRGSAKSAGKAATRLLALRNPLGRP